MMGDSSYGSISCKHITRVYLTGALMKPRELIWITGIMVASRTVGFGVSGYSLAWDQVAFW